MAVTNLIKINLDLTRLFGYNKIYYSSKHNKLLLIQMINAKGSIIVVDTDILENGKNFTYKSLKL